MNISAMISNQQHTQAVTVSTNNIEKTISIAAKQSGYGSSVNGGELLMLALATCFCNDIYREAAKRNINVTAVTVTCTGEFGAEGEPGKNFRYKPQIISDASPQQLQELIRYTDSIAEIHKTLRQGIAIQLDTE
jgi:uncharacterized OsmC-like protein